MRWAAHRGAQVVFHPHFHEAEPGGYRPTTFADPANSFHEKAALCRAAENTCFFATVNYASAGSPTTSAVVRPDGTPLAWQPYGRPGCSSRTSIFRRRRVCSPPAAGPAISAGRPEPISAALVFPSVTTFLLWCLLLVVCWPLALLALVLYPIVWLLLLPFRIVGIAVDGVLGVIRGIVMLPVRVLRGPRAA